MNAKKLPASAPASSRRATLVLLVLLAATGGASHGDWLVLASGEPIETKGPWTLEGRKIVFTSTRGVLSSIRASSVNVESSRALTTKKLEEASRVIVIAPAPKREPVLVLTDADFEQTKPAADPAVTGAAAAAQADTESAAAAQPIVVPAADSLETRVARQMPGAPSVQITSWSARPTGEDQISIFGTVQNVGSLVAAAITVSVKLFDSEGAQLGTSEAAITATALMPGVQAELEARFDGNPNFAAVEFSVTTIELEVGRRDGEEELEEPTEDQPTENRPRADAPRGDAPHARAADAAPAPQPE